jgi:hypothetical protein
MSLPMLLIDQHNKIIITSSFGLGNDEVGSPIEQKGGSEGFSIMVLTLLPRPRRSS